MVGEIEGRPVSTTNNLEPTRGQFSLGIPAIFGIVSHLFIKMLSKSDMMFDVEADFLQIQIYSSHEVAKGLVVDYALVDCLADGDPLMGKLFVLVLFAVEG